MENYIIELMKEMKERNIKEQEHPMRCGDETINMTYQVIESDEATLRIWNSSNSQSVHNLSSVLEDIRNEMLDGEESGNLSDGWNEIMWEIV